VVRLGLLGTAVDSLHDDTDDVVGRGVIDIVHDQRLVVSEARLNAEVGLWRRRRLGLSASVMAPLRVVVSRIVYRDDQGAPVQLVTPGIHHRDETLSGLSDPLLLAAGAWSPGGSWRLVLRLGATLPLGRTEDDPFALGDAGEAHQHIQLGTGTVNPTVVAEVARGLGDWRVGGFVFTQQVVYENGQGYQAGDRWAGGISARRRVGRTLALRGGAEVQGETAERWFGVVPTDDGNRGRLDVLLGAGAEWSGPGGLSLELGLKVPVYTKVVGGQLDIPAVLELGVGWAFGGGASAARPADDGHGDDDGHAHGDDDGHAHGDDDGHAHGDDDGHTHGDGDGHAHGDEHAHGDGDGHGDAEADIVDLVPAGAAVPLEPVAGKVTVIDFWAPWCEPCEELDPALRALARANPARIALRRLDVVDWDSEATARYLTPGGYGLPHVRVLGPDGAELFVGSPAPGELPAFIARVEAVVRRAAEPPGGR
jgi:thiol-disulfide isomerase/thioredoxin